ncbi:MAG: extracellular solute-binding protein [Candidatus Riflebacteria bacterium]|nr:extracellular solute-binding protein [Candidatus Riflebacteria bacterium]
MNFKTILLKKENCFSCAEHLGKNVTFQKSISNLWAIHAYIFVFTVFFSILPTFLNAQATELGPTELEIWDYPRWLEPGEKTDRFKWIKEQLKAFEIANPGVKVKLTEMSWARGDEKLKICAIAGKHPDIAPGTVPLLFIREGLVEPINEYLEPDDSKDYLEGALKAFSVEGKIYGWPWYMGGQLLFVNADILASAGASLPTDGRWTIDQFMETLKKIKAYQKEQGFYPLGIYFEKNETANFPFAFAYGGSWLNDKLEYRGNSPETIKGLQWLKGLVESGLVPPDSGGRNPQDAWDGFAREKRVAVAAFGLWAINSLKTKFPINFRIVHFPAENGKKNPSFLGVSGFYVFKNSNPKRVAAAMKLARFLTSSQNQQALVNYTQFPTRKSAGDIYSSDSAMQSAWDVLKEGTTIVSDARWPQFDEEIEAAVQGILIGKEDPRTVMKQAGERIVGQMGRKTGSINEDLSKSSFLGKVFLGIFPFAIFFAIFTGQIHVLFILPAITIIGLFLWYPLGDALAMAFRDYRLGSVGEYTISNFQRAFADPKFVTACFNTAIYTLVVVPANVFTALIAASLIASLGGRMKSFFRAMYYLPGVASVVVLTMVWRWIFNYDFGLINEVLKFFGIGGVGWITDPKVAFLSVMLTGILRSPGGSILIYLAAMANLPKSLYESAQLEGASPFQCWRMITVPLLRGTTLFLCITGCIDALQVFAQVFMLTNGGPGYSTEVVVHRIYTAAFRDFEFGLSSAMALILFIAILVVTVIQKKWAPSGDIELA